MNQDHDTTGYRSSSPQGEFGGRMNGQNQGAGSEKQAGESRDSSLPTLFELPDLTSQGLHMSRQSIQMSAHESHQGPPAGHVDPPSGNHENRTRIGPNGPNLPPGHVSPLNGHDAVETDFFRQDAAEEADGYSANVAANNRAGSDSFVEAEPSELAAFLRSKTSFIVLTLVMGTLAFIAGRSMHRLGDSVSEGRIADVEESANTDANQGSFASHSSVDSEMAADAIASVPRYARDTPDEIAIQTVEDSPTIGMDRGVAQMTESGSDDLLTNDELLSAYESLPNDAPSELDGNFNNFGSGSLNDELTFDRRERASDLNPADLGEPMIPSMSASKADQMYSHTPVPSEPGAGFPEKVGSDFSQSNYPSMIEQPDSVVGFRRDEPSTVASSGITSGLGQRSRFEEGLRYSATPNGFPDLLGLAESLGIWQKSSELDSTSGGNADPSAYDPSVNFDSAQ